jgi:hypothetical protein
MDRRVSLLAAVLAFVALAGVPVRAPATPFADVPADRWAYQAIAALAADGLVDGYPDGSFKGDRPLTRYEMAAIVARVIAKLEATGAQSASRTDLDKLQKLVDALKDELDGLGVRVTSLEDAVTSLDRRTRVAQAISVHGTILGNGSFQNLTAAPHSVTNGTGVPQTPYYAPAPVAPGAFTGIDRFVNAYASSPDDNNPLDALNGSQTLLRSDSRFDFIYAVDENVTVSVPVHVIDYGSAAGNAQQVAISPDVVIDVAQAGAFTNLTLREAQLDNIASSRLGLTYRAPTWRSKTTTRIRPNPFPRASSSAAFSAASRPFNSRSRASTKRCSTRSRISVRLRATASPTRTWRRWSRRRAASCRRARPKRPTRSAPVPAAWPACS